MLIPELQQAWPVDQVYIYLCRCACACFVYIHPSIHPCNTCQPRSPKGERTIVTLYYLAHNSSSDSVSSSPPPPLSFAAALLLRLLNGRARVGGMSSSSSPPPSSLTSSPSSSSSSRSQQKTSDFNLCQNIYSNHAIHPMDSSIIHLRRHKSKGLKVPLYNNLALAQWG